MEVGVSSGRSDGRQEVETSATKVLEMIVRSSWRGGKRMGERWKKQRSSKSTGPDRE